ncbi:hypothetical protein COT52_02235 [candidate division WWE3 bacterium CG08_land_8_20_14_0_20_43_13]|uniref:Radical SAM protein n=1 Tax=candidate division WWE3 bacterium CG08_land_8_20_14_0_20_43_13 TaxID=1975087 RepID=A0A2H0X7B7_UNCKA|nr:MAG: hypothetical protein COT52_02235 [candidate division WWE3 bacterium CG08_land_8_20_14_0_20_43_13]
MDSNKAWLKATSRLKYFRLAQAAFLFKNCSKEYPSCLNVEVTNRCNLACRFCPRPQMTRAVGDMELDFFKHLLAQLKPLPKLSRLLLYKDGEPLLHPQFDLFVSLAKRENVAKRIEIHTNGLLLNKDNYDRIINCGLDVIIVSLDAVSSKGYQDLKGVDGFNIACSNLNGLIRRRDELHRRLPLVIARGVRQGELIAGEKEFRALFEGSSDLVELAPLHEWDGSVPKLSDKKNVYKRQPCVIPWYNPVVLWDGRLAACCVSYQDNEMVMGDLNGQLLKDVWRGEKYQSLREAHLEKDFTAWPTCAACPHWQAHPGWALGLKRLFL